MFTRRLSMAGLRLHLPRKRHWPGVLAVLTMLALLLAIHHVVRGAVAQGELRRQTVAVQAQATWSCQGLRGRTVSRECLVKLGTAP